MPIPTAQEIRGSQVDSEDWLRSTVQHLEHELIYNQVSLRAGLHIPFRYEYGSENWGKRYRELGRLLTDSGYAVRVVEVEADPVNPTLVICLPEFATAGFLMPEGWARVS